MLLLLPVFVLLATGCNEETGGQPAAEASASASGIATSPSPTPEPSPSVSSSPKTGDHPACEPAQRVSDLDDKVTTELTEKLSELVASAGGQGISDEQFEDFAKTVQEVVRESVPDLIAAYEDLAAALSPKLAKHAQTLADFTDSFTKDLLGLSPEELENIDELFQTPEAFEAVGATLALDKFTQEECGIVLAD